MWLSQNSFSWVRQSCCSNRAARFNLRIKLRKNMGFRLFTYGAEKLSSVGSQRANLLQEGSAALQNSPDTQGEHRERIFLEDSHFPGNHLSSVMCRDTTAVLAPALPSSQAVSISLVFHSYLERGWEQVTKLLLSSWCFDQTWRDVNIPHKELNRFPWHACL